MRHDSEFSVRYLTDVPVPIRDVIESLHGVETVLGEVGRLLPKMVDGLDVDRVQIKVRQIAQESPLREIFLLSIFLAFQEDLEGEVIGQIEGLGYKVPDNLETIITLLALIIVFYGVGTIRDLVLGKATDGPAKRRLDGLITELSSDTGKTEEEIRAVLDGRYGEPTMAKRIANAASRFFTPSKRRDSAPVEVNDRTIDNETMQDVPAQYLADHEAKTRPSRDFYDVELELHAQDKDHTGQGWAAIARGITEKRVRLKLLEQVNPNDLWGRDEVTGDISVIYDKVGAELIPKEIQLHHISSMGK